MLFVASTFGDDLTYNSIPFPIEKLKHIFACENENTK